MKTPIITVKELTKQFSVYHKPYEVLLDLLPYFSSKIQKHTALDNVSFELHRGEFLGIIGQNGSGKSTLLKILCGVLHQTFGQISINGRVLSLLELGTGFNPDLTGRENLFISASLMGFDTKLITERITDIEAFADIEEYFDAPVKTYSSGMYVRLAMAMFLHLDPEIFIIDEALSVGDIFFQQKCFSKIEEMRNNGVTFLFVSHDLGLIAKVCDRVAYIEHGKLIYIGDRTTACQKYYTSKTFDGVISSVSCEKILQNNNILPSHRSKEHGGAEIIGLEVINQKEQPTLVVEMMESLFFKFTIRCYQEISNMALGIVFRNNQNTIISAIIHDIESSKGFYKINILIPFTIEAGNYTFDLYIGARNPDTNFNTADPIYEIKNCGVITVIFDYASQIAPFFGQCYLETKLIKSTHYEDLQN